MDLVALLYQDGLFTVHRTMSWEKIIFKSASDLEILSPVVISFNDNGKVIGIGSENGAITLYCLEGGLIYQAFQFSSADTRDTRVINNLVWISCDDNSSSGQFNVSNILSNNGRIENAMNNMTNVLELKDHANDQQSVSNSSAEIELDVLFGFVESMILISTTCDGLCCGYMYGIFPLFSIDVAKLSSDYCDKLKIFPTISTPLYAGLCLQYEMSANTMSYRSFNLNSLRNIFFIRNQLAIYLSKITRDLNKLHDIITIGGKKWKEAIKPIIPKLSLLQGLLDSYQIIMSPVEFMYTITNCGFWHPASSTTFSQHWNEQGLSRLRSAVDSSSRTFIKQLHFRALPIATNIVLKCKSLLLIPLEDQLHTEIKKVTLSSELLLLKLDDTLNEAKLARESMLLYLNFIKDCSTGAAQDTNGQVQKLDTTLREKCRKIFDPRKYRAPSKGNDIQAESVTGTHLYAYTQDSELPKDLIESRKQQSIIDNTPGAHHVISPADQNLKYSLLQQIRITKELVQEVMSSQQILLSSQVAQLIKSSSNLLINSANPLSNIIFEDALCRDSLVVPTYSINVVNSENLKQIVHCVTHVVAGTFFDSTTGAMKNELYILMYAMGQLGMLFYSQNLIASFTDIGAIDRTKLSVKFDTATNKYNLFNNMILRDINGQNHLGAMSIDDISFTSMHLTTGSAIKFYELREIIIKNCQPTAVTLKFSQPLEVTTIDVFDVCGPRGIVMMTEANGKIVILDLDNENDEEMVEGFS